MKHSVESPWATTSLKRPLNFSWISLLLLQIPRHIIAVSADVSRVCDVVYEEERSWSRVNRPVLRMYGAKPYQFEPTYLLLSTERRTSAKRRRKRFYTTSFPLTPQFCATVLGPRFAHEIIFLLLQSTTCENTFGNRLSIPLRFTLKYIIFWVQFPFKRPPTCTRKPDIKSVSLRGIPLYYISKAYEKNCGEQDVVMHEISTGCNCLSFCLIIARPLLSVFEFTLHCVIHVC